jgi:hypothetical protein
MTIPAAENIEEAVTALQKLQTWILEDQVKELHSAIGADTAKLLGIAFPLCNEFEEGYQLGLQTARAMGANI